MGKIKGFLAKALGGIKNSFLETMKEIKWFGKNFMKEYKRISKESKKKSSGKEENTSSSISKEKAEELRNQYAQWRQKIAESAQISKLDPSNYHSKEELYLGILEDMGLNEKFKDNPIAKQDLTQLLKDILKDMAEENQEIEGNLQKEFRNFTEQDAQFLKEKLGENQKIEIDEQGDFKYIENLKQENDTYLDENDYTAIYFKREFKIEENNFIQEMIEKRCDMEYDEAQGKYKGNEIESAAVRIVYNQQGIEMEKEAHKAITELVDDIEDENIWTYINGDNETVEDIAGLENVLSRKLQRTEVIGIICEYIDKTKQPHDRGKIKTMNDSADLKELDISREKMKALINKDIQKINEFEKEMQISNEEKKQILKEKIENSSEKEALTKMGEEAGILDREEERTV